MYVNAHFLHGACVIGPLSDCKTLLQTSPLSPAFQFKSDGLYTPCWHEEEVRSSAPHPTQADHGSLFVEKKTPRWHEEEVRSSPTQADHGDLCVENKKTIGNRYEEMEKRKMTAIAEKGHLRAPEEEEDEAPTSIGESLTMVASLAACAKQKDLLRGCKLHADVVGKGLFGKNAFVGSALVNMYAKCSAFAKAQKLFNELPVRNVVSWNALVAGYTQQGYAEEALACFEQMQHEGFSPDAVTFACILKACGSAQEAAKGQHIHALVVREGLLERNIVVANALLDMYAKCGLVSKAQEVFDELPVWDLVSWNVLILGYTQQGHAEKALYSFYQMKRQGFSPDAFTFVCILKACASVGDAEKGQEIHVELITEEAEEGNVVVGSALVDMYANCHMLADAHEVLVELPARNVILWTALIEGYVQHGHVEKAFTCYQQMRCERISPDAMTLVCILKACGSMGAADKGQEIHAEIVRDELEDQDMDVGTALLDMYANCGMLAESQEVFDELPVRNAVSWTALIAIYGQRGYGEEALNCYKQMQLEGFSPDAVTFACVLKACGSIAALGKGREAHTEIVKRGLLDKSKGLLDRNNAVAGALVDMYAKCGLLADAEEVFTSFSFRDVVSWSALASGYAQHGHGDEALNCYEQMQSEGFYPDAVTFACILKACGSIEAAFRGKEIHSAVVKVGLLEEDVVVGTAVVDMYAKCGMLDEAEDVFDQLPVWDVFSWTALIAGYAQHAYGEEALRCFEQMELEGTSPSAITFISILKACGSIGAICKSQKLHAEIVKQGLLEENMFVGTALVDMYANCGMVVEAQEMFDKLPVQNQVSWNMLIAGYVLLSKDELVFSLFNKLVEEGKEPDLITFTLVLNTCSNRGLVDKGQFYFEAMSTTFGISPTLEHCNCIVDLFGRAGHLDMAVAVIEEIPVLADPTMWHSVLAACQKRSNVNLGQWAFQHAAQGDVRDGAAYVSMRNILYSS